MQKKKGISLIVLVITIIVMIILAGAIILTLNNSEIIEKAQQAINETNLKEIQSLATIKWAEAYMIGKVTPKELEEEILNSLNEQKIDLAPYEITVTNEGVTVTLKDPNKNPWIVATVDGVPIPKGFVASGATGENTKQGGLVIYEGTEPVTDANVDQARRERNQYVWIPVEDFSKFVRTDFTTNTALDNDIPNGYWEVEPGLDLELTIEIPGEYYECMDAIDDEGICSSYPKTKTVKISDYISVEELNEVTEMYESVKANKGFYIARYEAGSDVVYATKGEAVYSKMNKLPVLVSDVMATSKSVYSIEDSNYGVVSTLTYGVQWDSMLQWLNGKGVNISDSTDYGNYYNSDIPNSTFNEGSKHTSGDDEYYIPVTSDYSKVASQSDLLSTGATTKTAKNNIYDIAGNKCEVTMEHYGIYNVVRGGSYWNRGNSKSVSGRGKSDGSDNPGIVVRFPLCSLH